MDAPRTAAKRMRDAKRIRDVKRMRDVKRILSAKRMLALRTRAHLQTRSNVRKTPDTLQHRLRSQARATLSIYIFLSSCLGSSSPGRDLGIVFIKHFDYMLVDTQRKPRNSSLQFRPGTKHL